MLATLDLVQKNIDRLSPWRDIINLFLSEAIETVLLEDFVEDASDYITRDNVMTKFCEAGEDLLRLVSAKAALEHAITICEGQWGWVLRGEGQHS